MIGSAVRIGVMGAIALVGTMHVASSIPRVASDPRVTALEAQWKVATGDPEGAYQVLRRADARRQAPPVSHPTQARSAQQTAASIGS